MLLDWFNAREAIQVGARLADHFRPDERPSVPERRNSGSLKDWRKDVQRFRQRVSQEAGPLKLNLFKRAKLLNSFKWKLLEHGFDPAAADDLTHELLMQLCVPRGESAGREREAAEGTAAGRSLKRIPSLLGEADARFAERKYTESVRRLQEVLAIDRRHVVAHAKLGAALSNLGRYPEAEREFRQAIEFESGCADAHFNLGTLLQLRGELAASETALRQAVRRDPRNPEALVGLGLTLAMRRQLSDAKGCFEKSLRVKPRNASALCGLGWLATIEGRFEAAETLFQDALEVDPRKSAAWASLAGLRRMTDADKEWLEGVELTLASGVPPLEESRLRFAMGKYFDDLGSYSRAFEQYKRGNELYKLIVAPFDRASRTQFVDDVIRVYTRQRPGQPVEGASEAVIPVLVTGMMRSGTSLVEQIIASHPDAAGAGELDFWTEAARRYPQIIRSELPDAALTKTLAESYLRTLARYSRHASRIVDKSTFNADYLGLIHFAVPKARIVYLRRDPIDTCLSCYFQDFANAASFAWDLSDLAYYYREHHRLVAHWRTVLPADAFLEVPYTGLVAEPEAWSRRIIEFIGLEWDPRCLEYHRTERPVLTASNWQVRQRIYSRSVERWRNYEKFVGPLLKLRELAS